MQEHNDDLAIAGGSLLSMLDRLAFELFPEDGIFSFSLGNISEFLSADYKLKWPGKA